MAKSKIILLGALFLSASVCSAQPSREGLRDAVIQTAASQLHVRELSGAQRWRSGGSLPPIRWPKKGDAWCAAFVAWCYQRHGIKSPKSGWSPSWFPTTNVIYTRGRKGSVKNPARPTCSVCGLPTLKESPTWDSSNPGATHTQQPSREIPQQQTKAPAPVRVTVFYRKRRLTRQIYTVSSWI